MRRARKAYSRAGRVKAGDTEHFRRARRGGRKNDLSSNLGYTHRVRSTQVDTDNLTHKINPPKKLFTIDMLNWRP